MYCIVNPTAARGRGDGRWRRALARLEAGGRTVRFDLTTGPGNAQWLASAAVRRGEELVVAVGGDGTVNEVVNGLMEAGGGPVLGILPAGTGNDTAREAGMPPAMLQAADVLAGTTTTRRQDVGRAAGRFFANGFGAGFSGEVSHRADDAKILPGVLGYLVTAVRLLATHPAPWLEVRCAEERWSGRALLVEVGNGRWCGGGFRLTPEARPDDGVLDVTVIEDMPRLQAAWLLPAALRGRHLSSDRVHTFRAEALAVGLEAPVSAHLDGNLLTLVPPRVDVELETASLEVLHPES